MRLKGEVTIRAPRKQVWDFMTDPEQIGQCAPGVEKIEVVEPLKRYRGVVSVGFGAEELNLLINDLECLRTRKCRRKIR